MIMNKLKTLLCLSALLSLAACQQKEDLPTSVENRWAAVIAQEYDKAYDYFSPGYKAIEAPDAYKDIDEVIQVSHDLGILTKIARLVPVGVIKG